MQKDFQQEPRSEPNYKEYKSGSYAQGDEEKAHAACTSTLGVTATILVNVSTRTGTNNRVPDRNLLREPSTH